MEGARFRTRARHGWCADGLPAVLKRVRVEAQVLAIVRVPVIAVVTALPESLIVAGAPSVRSAVASASSPGWKGSSAPASSQIRSPVNAAGSAGFHMPRALYLAKAAGLDATGLTADLRGYGEQEQRSQVREILARTKAVADVALNTGVLLGPPVPITGDARASWGPVPPPGTPPAGAPGVAHPGG
jgi:hypothetical protein